MTIEALSRLNQEHLLNSSIPPEELNSIDWETVEKQMALIPGDAILLRPDSAAIEPITPTGASPYSDHPVPFLYQKRVGVLIMAGGQATRLNSPLPKGVLPVSPVHHKSILQLIAEKITAFAACYKAFVHTAIMTSEATDGAIKAHFALNNNFTLPTVDFFVQDSLPLLDLEKKLIIHQTHLLKGPDGNGKLFHYFLQSGLYEKWREDGIEAISIITCDNPLIDPFHPGLLIPLFYGRDFAAAAVERTEPKEQVGLFALKNGQLTVVEYSEIEPEEAAGRDAWGHLLFRWANIAFFACTLDFAKRASTSILPLHMARKKTNGHEAWKAEYFIFDTFCQASKPTLVPMEREAYFAPLKSSTGPTCLAEVQQAMMRRDRAFLQRLGKIPQEGPIELPQEAFYLPTDRHQDAVER